jgi:hypothetical protein
MACHPMLPAAISKSTVFIDVASMVLL